MQKLKYFSLLFIVLGATFLVSCIDNESTVEAILIQDKEAILKYLEENPLEGEKEYIDEDAGIYMFWERVSESGVKPARFDTVSVDYTGKLLTNRVFDSSIESVARDNGVFNPQRNYIPLRFLMGGGQLIEGFESAIGLMEQGDKATVIFPSIFGYGSSAENGIPANSPLIFEIEVIEIKKAN